MVVILEVERYWRVGAFASSGSLIDSLPSTFSRASESVSDVSRKLYFETFLLMWILSQGVLSSTLITETLAPLEDSAVFSLAVFSSSTGTSLAFGMTSSLAVGATSSLAFLASFSLEGIAVGHLLGELLGIEFGELLGVELGELLGVELGELLGAELGELLV